MQTLRTAAVVGYDKCSEQDTITALEVLRGASMVLAGKIAPWKRKAPAATFDVKLMGLLPGNITMQMGTQAVSDGVVGAGDLYDLLYVPGGIGSGAASLDPAMLGLIRRHYEAGKVVASNCSGVGILARSGILGKNPVTCVAAVAPGLREQGINVPAHRRMWLGLPEARIWTATGSYGVNGGAVALVSHYFGREVGTIVAMMFDTMGGIGEAIYNLEGPEFYLHPHLESEFAAYFKPMLLPEQRGMITVIARQTVTPGQEDTLKALMADLTAKVKAAEPGCATFDWVRDGTSQDYVVIEQYVDDAAFELHKGTPYLQAFVPKLMPCLAAPLSVTVYGDVVRRPPPHPSYFHIGVVVPDLAAAVARYSDVLGIRFTEPATFRVPRLEDPDPHPGELVAAFSMTEPPYYELIQAAGDGIIAARNAGRILYFGVWEPDMAGRLEALRAQKVGIDALFRMDADSPPFAMITAPDLSGARIEYVDVADKGPIEEWVRTGRFPGGIGQG